MIQDNQYIQIEGWMVTKLGLTGTDLIIFALIYSFTSKKKYFTGSLSYMEKWTGKTRKTVISSLKKLCEAGFIVKESREVAKHQTAVSYRVNIGRCKNYTGGGGKITQGRCKNYTDSGGKITPNNTIENTSIYKDTKTKRNQKNRFNNFDQREYNYGELEKALLQKQLKGDNNES